MMQLKGWQWGVLALPMVGVVGFVLVAAGLQIHAWGLNWIWALILLVFVGWRFLLVRWLKPSDLAMAQSAVAEVSAAVSSLESTTSVKKQRQQAESVIYQILDRARADGPPWENWSLFFQRCQELVEAIAIIYAPQAKRPLLNIYIPQAYSLMRGTVDDVDQWMQKLSPILGQVTIDQAYRAYETYQTLEPSARFLLKAWNWAQWVFNPLVALARTTTQGYTAQANQQLLLNLGQLLREKTLIALGERAIALYSGELPQPLAPQEVSAVVPTETLRELLNQAVQSQPIEQQPLNILLLGRTGAGKSSLVNSLFRQELATVDALPSTDALQSYPFSTPTGDVLLLWDSPGYEQVGMEQYSQLVLEKAQAADLVLLVTPVQDPTLQMDLERLTILKRQAADLPILTAVTQVDRLRPQREWEPPYDWMMGDRPKERNIREAIIYRQHCLESYCSIVLPVVTEDLTQHRAAWGISDLSHAILDTLEPAQQFRMSRFLRDLETRTQTAARIIDQYILQMSTTQGLTALFKRPILQFISTLLTGSPTLALLLAEKVPLEQSPIFLGKLQMAVELYTLLCPADFGLPAALLQIWPLLLEPSDSIAHDAWALGHTLVEYWAPPSISADNPSGADLPQRYRAYLQQIQSQSIQ